MTTVQDRPTASRTRTHVDFNAVEQHQREIDARLRNWGRWCNGTGRASVCPMFRLTPPSPRQRGDGATYADTVDGADAARLAPQVSALPEKHRAAINWAYVRPVSPRQACESIGASMEGLYRLLRDGRQMLINKGN